MVSNLSFRSYFGFISGPFSAPTILSPSGTVFHGVNYLVDPLNLVIKLVQGIVISQARGRDPIPYMIKKYIFSYFLVIESVV